MFLIVQKNYDSVIVKKNHKRKAVLVYIAMIHGASKTLHNVSYYQVKFDVLWSNLSAIGATGLKTEAYKCDLQKVLCRN